MDSCAQRYWTTRNRRSRLNEDEIVDGGVVRKATDLGMSSLIGDMIWVTFDAGTKEVIKIYE